MLLCRLYRTSKEMLEVISVRPSVVYWWQSDHINEIQLWFQLSSYSFYRYRCQKLTLQFYLYSHYPCCCVFRFIFLLMLILQSSIASEILTYNINTQQWKKYECKYNCSILLGDAFYMHQILRTVGLPCFITDTFLGVIKSWQLIMKFFPAFISIPPHPILLCDLVV